jgi:putative oxidoreductase
MILHGIAKLSSGVDPISGMLAARGLPALFAWGVYIGEVIGPILIIVGLYTRLGALFVIANMIVAISLAHSTQLFQLSKTGGWSLELQGLFLFGALAVMLLGAGSYSVGGRHGRWN